MLMGRMRRRRNRRANLSKRDELREIGGPRILSETSFPYDPEGIFCS